MFMANFEDGETITSNQCYWTDLPRNKRITGVQLLHPRLPKLNICLTSYDRYYFMMEAFAFQGSQHGKVVAEIIGAHDLELGVGTEVRLDYSGSVKVKLYRLSRFKHSPDILLNGKSNGETPQLKGLPEDVQVEQQAETD